MDVRSRRCTAPSCRTQPSFGKEGESAIHCAEHREEGEIDVRSAICLEPGCGVHPSFGTEPGKPIHCAEHKQQEEHYVRYCRRCTAPGCGVQASFGTEKGKAVHCSEHRQPKEANVVTKRCSEPECETFAVCEGFCTIHHPDYIPSKRGASKVACEFIDLVQCQLGLPGIQHKHYGKISKAVDGYEFRVPSTLWHADGFVHRDDFDGKAELPFAVGEKGVVLEFHGHEWHGYPDGKHAEELNCRGALYGDLYEATMARMRAIKQRGYTVVYIWESDFASCKKQVAKTIFSYCHFL